VANTRPHVCDQEKAASLQQAQGNLFAKAAQSSQLPFQVGFQQLMCTWMPLSKPFLLQLWYITSGTAYVRLSCSFVPTVLSGLLHF
jgi:hypothetical protein